MMILNAICFLVTLVAAPAWQSEVEHIDRQIEVLVDEQEKLKAQMERDANNAMRWQFQRENYLDARRAWDQVARDKQLIQELQDEINTLQQKKAEILKEHGQAPSP